MPGKIAVVSAVRCALGLLFLANSLSAATFTVEKSELGVTVKLDGQLFTEYLIRSGNKPILWPIVGPTGQPITRAYPMKKLSEEKARDHEHHRSLWLTHGDVNGENFWAETPGTGKIVHREFVDVAGGDTARIVTRNDWIAHDGKKVCEDQRTFVFRAAGDQRIIDFEAIITASEGPLKFGDTKEGSFGMRVPETMRVDAKLGGKIINSEGQANEAAWGQPAAWVDYHGPVDGQQIGIAMLDHPSSFRYPNRWHVRTYGLFAANPFGRKEFGATDGPGGPFTLEKGKTLTLRYRIILHRGDEQSAHIADAFAAYAKENFSDGLKTVGK